MGAPGDTEAQSTRHVVRPAAGPEPVRVGPYRIEGELGRGGMGIVYRAFDERLHRSVALKALPEAVASDAAARAQLEREARALASVSHPNVATIHGLEESAGTLYVVLELVAGQTLHARLDGSALDLAEAVALCGQVASGLEAVHGRGLVHRDLKPGNVMVTPEGVAKILDFGLARRDVTAHRDTTITDSIAGTPGYMSPEHLRGEVLDVRNDVFAWGCLLHECLSGEGPFPGGSSAERIAATLEREPAWERLPATTPPAVTDLLRACLSKDRRARPATMDDARRWLESAGGAARGAVPVHRRTALPAEHDVFVGREEDLAELRRRLLEESTRLLSVLGLGGTGKTRLAVHFARTDADAWPGGAWFCDLSEARSVQGIVHAVASAFDVPLGKVDPVVQLGHAIAGRGRCLVILDNFEQVAKHAQDTLGPWLRRCTEASFLVTTREVLGLPGEQALALAPLQPEDAVALFEARALAAGRGEPASSSDGERGSVLSLVKLLDHLPLAIELAAARVRIMPVSQVLARMGERFKLLSRGGTRRDRQATLRATLDWSWDLLSGWEKSALAQLSTFEGGFTLETAESVLELSAWDEAPWTVDVVQALLDKSLVRRIDEERFDLLASVQEYAAEKLHAPGGGAGSGAAARRATEARHGECFARRGTDEALDALDAHGGVARRRELERELENVAAACRRAVARGDAGVAAATCRAAWAVLELKGPLATGAELAESVLSLPELRAADRAAVLRVAGVACLFSGRMAEARSCFESALAMHREVGNRRSEAIVLGNLGLLHLGQGRVDEARACFELALAIAREVGERRIAAVVLGSLGNLHREQGRMDEARAHCESALVIAREVGNRRVEGLALGNLGNVHREQGRMDEARACFESALAIHREVGGRRAEGHVLGNLGSLHFEQGRMDEARMRLESALAIAREVGDRRGEGVVLVNLGLLHLEQSRLDGARACQESALVIAREAGDRRIEGYALGSLGLLDVREGRLDEARLRLGDAEALLRATGDRLGLAKVLCARAEAAHADRDAAAARAGLDEADGLAADVGADAASEIGRDLVRLRALLNSTVTGGAA